MRRDGRKCLVWVAVIAASSAGTTVARQLPAPLSDAAAAIRLTAALQQEIGRVAALGGEPYSVSSAGVTRSDVPLLTIENTAPFDAGAPRRLVLVGGLDGDVRGAQAVLSAVRWFKTMAPPAARRMWAVSALPFANPTEDSGRGSLRFPPDKGFFDGPDQGPYVWRWVAFQAPDLVIEVQGGNALSWQGDERPSFNASKLPDGSLAAALSRPDASGLGSVPGLIVTAAAGDGPQVMQTVLKVAAGLKQSPLHTAIDARVRRNPRDIASLLAHRYPATPSISYITAVAWVNTLRFAAITGDQTLSAKVLQQTAPWTSNKAPLFGERIALTAVAGTMIFADLAEKENDDASRLLAIEGAKAATLQKENGIPQYGQGWTDDMFMSAAILARTGKMKGREQDLDYVANLLLAYAARLQRPDGIFIHAADAPHAWGRGNGFAALGLMEVLTALPDTHPARSRVLDIYRRQMSGLRTAQAPDGMWRQVVDEPGSYREESVTAMIVSAMARGIRLGWLENTYAPIVTRAWRGLAAHVAPDGAVVDVCTNTGAGPTRRYYLDRPAITGPDDRGGAMGLLSAVEMQELSVRFPGIKSLTAK
jgi:unsaturated rhamnogalacturonyl hydrolase